jgi:hypothetical protein
MHLGMLPYIKFDPHARLLIVCCNSDLTGIVLKSIRRQGPTVAVLPVLRCGVPILHLAPHSVTQEQRRLLYYGMSRHDRCGALIRLDTMRPLLKDPYLMPSLWPVAAAIDRICIVCHVNVTVLDGMHIFSVRDKAS